MAESEQPEEYRIDFLTEGATTMTGIGATDLDVSLAAVPASIDVEVTGVDLDGLGVLKTTLDPNGADDFEFRLDGALGSNYENHHNSNQGTVDEHGLDFEIDYEEEAQGATHNANSEDVAASLPQTSIFPSPDEQNQPPKDEDEIGYESDEQENTIAQSTEQVQVLEELNTSDPQDETRQLDRALPDESRIQFGAEPGIGSVGEDPSVDMKERGATPASHVEEAEEVTSLDGLDDSQSPVESLDVLVTWNDEQYSLLGQEDDDPDSYFLSDASEIDNTLTKLLSRLREVVTEEIADNQELLVRVPQLNLEFGEKSNESFLSRSFREILTCFRKLALNEGTSPMTMHLELAVRQECEDRFLELLEAADQGKGLADVIDYDSPDQYESSPEKSSFDREDDDVTAEEQVNDYSLEDGGSPGEVLVEVSAEQTGQAAANAPEDGLAEDFGDTEGQELYPGIASPFGENLERQGLTYEGLDEIQDGFQPQNDGEDAGATGQDVDVEFELAQTEFEQEADGLGSAFEAADMDLADNFGDLEGTNGLDVGNNQEEAEETVAPTDGNDPQFSSPHFLFPNPKEAQPSTGDNSSRHQDNNDDLEEEINQWLEELPDEDEDRSYGPIHLATKRLISQFAESSSPKRVKIGQGRQYLGNEDFIGHALAHGTQTLSQGDEMQQPEETLDRTNAEPEYLPGAEELDFDGSLTCKRKVDTGTNKQRTSSRLGQPFAPQSIASVTKLQQDRTHGTDSDASPKSSKFSLNSASKEQTHNTMLPLSHHRSESSSTLHPATDTNIHDREDARSVLNVNVIDNAAGEPNINEVPASHDHEDGVVDDDERKFDVQPTGVEINANGANDKVIPDGSTHDTAPTVFSNGTSATSTLNGEELNTSHQTYDSTKGNGDDSEPDQIQQPIDEIDWESGDDEPKQLEPADKTSPSVYMKRGRDIDNETSLVDESDNKRRRT